MNKSMNKVIKSHVVLAVLTVFSVVLLAGGLTYALFQMENPNTENQKIAIGNLSANLSSVSGKIVLNDLYPENAADITDEDLKYLFTVTNDGDYDIDYEIYLTDETTSFLADSANASYSSYKKIVPEHYKYINYKLDGKESFSNLADLETNSKKVILTGSLKVGESEDHYLQFFLDQSAPNDIAGSILSVDIHMTAGIQGAKLSESEKTLNLLGLKVNSSTPNFATPATTDETVDGLFGMEDDSGMSYYFRGTAPNNYIKFGQDASGQDMWWRIIRINGDGTVRIQYDGAGDAGTNTYTRGFAITGQVWNSNYDDAKYVGWMYGGANGSASTSREQAQRNETDSSIKTKVDEWYKTNIVDTGYGNYVADSIFCNDRSTPGKSATGWSSDTGLGYGSNVTAYGATARVGGPWQTTVTQPQFTCLQENDKFTVEAENGGNGKSTYPVGLITADEIVAAGSGKYGTTNSSYYLKKGSWYWSFSPYSVSSNGDAFVFVVYSGGDLGNYIVNNSGAVAPVINLKAEYLSQLRGTGTATDPFRLS